MIKVFRAVVAVMIAIVSLSGYSFAAEVSDIKVYSKSMDKEIDCSIILPDGYTSESRYPVVYLLHGHGQDYRAWVDKFDTESLSDLYNIIIVSPDGGRNSWYWDSPINPELRYETFVSGELIEYIDTNYSTKASREGRGVAGLSMGGHGAMYLAIRHSDTFGAVGSMSGGVDIRPFPYSWGMAQHIGSQAENPQRWFDYTVMGQLHRLAPDTLEILVDCGTEDFFLAVNNELHNQLNYRGIPHTYITRKGAHTLDYWRVSIMHQMLFFDTYFNKEK